MKNKLIESIENAYGELWNGLQGEHELAYCYEKEGIL